MNKFLIKDEEIKNFLNYMRLEIMKISSINDKIFDSLQEMMINDNESFYLTKNLSNKLDFNNFALLMREYGIILPFQKILYDLSIKYFNKKEIYDN
jgi:hypothetical protein